MELTLGVTLAVLAAGFLHADWNALLKSSGGGDVTARHCRSRCGIVDLRA